MAKDNNAKLFDKWNKKVDLKGLKNDIQDAKDNPTGNYVDVPHGEYEVTLTRCELKESKNGRLMASLGFKVLVGDYKGQYIWMNQIVEEGFQIHILNEFLESLDTGIEIVFEDYAQYNDLLMDVLEEATKQKLEYALEYDCNSKGYDTYNITEIFD